MKTKRTLNLDEINRMSVDQLWDIHKEIGSVLAQRIAAEKAVLDERLKRLELLSPARTGKATIRTRRPYPQVFAKYGNPDNPADTWSGRGKQPRWLVAQLKSGKKLDHFRIEPGGARVPRSTR
jgi:DNA-binding protein H-NS